MSKLPQRGGSYKQDGKGNLKRVAGTQPAEGSKPAVNTPSKEADNEA